MASGRARLSARLASGVVCAALLAGCGGGSTPSRSRVQAALITSGLPPAEARCATKQLFTVLRPSQLRNLAERGSGALDDKSATALSTALGTCAASAGSTPSSEPTSPSAATQPQTAPSTSAP